MPEQYQHEYEQEVQRIDVQSLRVLCLVGAAFQLPNWLLLSIFLTLLLGANVPLAIGIAKRSRRKQNPEARVD